MHTRRMATFVLGVWIGCSVLMGFIAIQNLRMPAGIAGAPSAGALPLLQKLTPEESQLLLRYQSSEQNRRYLYIWETAEIGLGLALAACLFFGTQRRLFPQILGALMLMLVLFEHFALTPEMTYRGREADFPPGNSSFGIQARIWALNEAYVASEGAKLVLGGILTSYLFVFRARRRARRAEGAGEPDPTHVES